MHGRKAKKLMTNAIRIRKKKNLSYDLEQKSLPYKQTRANSVFQNDLEMVLREDHEMSMTSTSCIDERKNSYTMPSSCHNYRKSSNTKPSSCVTKKEK